MVYDPDEVDIDQMLQTITDTGYEPSLAKSRITSASTEELTGDLPPLIRTALHEAQSTGKRVFVDFYAKWCGACRTMDETTFADAAIIDALDRGYVFVKVDTDVHPEISRQFSVVGLPTIVALNDAGGVVYRHAGPLQAEALLAALQRIESGFTSGNQSAR